MLFFKLILILFCFNSVLTKIIDLDGAMQIAGDVSISPSRFFMKKSFVNRSIKPYLSEQNVEQKLRFTKSLIDSTTPKPTIHPIYLNKSINQLTNKIEKESDYLSNDKLRFSNYKNEKSRTNNSVEYDKLKRIYLNQDINSLIKNDNEIEDQLKVVTYSTLENDFEDIRNFFNSFNNRKKQDKEIEKIIQSNELNNLPYERSQKIRKDRMSEDRLNEIRQYNNIKTPKPNYPTNKNDYTNQIHPIEPINPSINSNPTRANLNKKFYKTIVVDFPDKKNKDSDQYPIKFVEQYRCDLNVSKCGLYNDLQLRDMFYLEDIQDIYNKRRCYVADTTHARKSNQFGARLITQYFHVFGLGDACFELEYFANGPGIRKMEIAQQDSGTKIIWTLQDNDIGAELSFKKFRKLKVPIKLQKTEPRFFITVNLNPYKIGTIGILGFNFTYTKCDQALI